MVHVYEEDQIAREALYGHIRYKGRRRKIHRFYTPFLTPPAVYPVMESTGTGEYSVTTSLATACQAFASNRAKALERKISRDTSTRISTSTISPRHTRPGRAKQSADIDYQLA